MQDFSHWQGLPYYAISQFYRETFGEKVYKLPVSLAESCPNRDGLKGMKPCVFCDVWGSAAYPEFRDLDLRRQIEKTRERIRGRFNAHRFLVYFQAYTNTFTRVSNLRRAFTIADEFEDVAGMVVGTRPDCLSDGIFDLWNEYAARKFVGVELGVQSFNEDQLLWMQRGHTAQKSIQAIQRIKKFCPKVNIGIHLIFGLPGEQEQDMPAVARLVNSLPVDNVKLHNLHVLKKTPLEEQFQRGEFVPLERAAYTRRVLSFLAHLRPDIAVHRVAAVASRHDELVAPDWVRSKLDSYQYVLDRFHAEQIWQGQALGPLGKT